MKQLIFTVALCFVTTLAFSQTTSLKVTAAGDVGIGTDTPSEKLEVDGLMKSGGATFETPNTSATLLAERQDRAAILFGAGYNAGLTYDNSYGFGFMSAPRTEILNRILTVSAGSGGLMIMNLNANGNVAIGKWNAAEKLEVNGNVLAAAYNTVSDKRLKTNVKDFTDGLNVITKLNPISYNYNGKAEISNTERRYISLFAQDLQKAAPYLVEDFTHKNVDERGDVVSEETYLQIHDSEIKYLLINSIKQQQEIIESQQEAIDELTSELALVKGLLTGQESAAATSVETLDKGAALGQNFPNPLKGETTVLFYIPTDVSTANIQIYSLSGQLVKTIDIADRGNGYINLDLSGLASGNYNYSLFVDGELAGTKKMSVQR